MANKILEESEDINNLRKVAGKAEKLYLRTRNSASSQSAKRARELVSSNGWGQLHRVFGEDAQIEQAARADMLAKISGYKPQETIFEVAHGDKGRSMAAEMMKDLRTRIVPRGRNHTKEFDDKEEEEDEPEELAGDVDVDMASDASDGDGADAYDDMYDELEVKVNDPDEKGPNGNKSKSKNKKDWKDSEVFMSYTPRNTNAAEERGYGVHSGGQGSSFVEAARDATMDLTNDETAKGFGAPSRQKMRWDSKAKKYVSRDNDEDGSKGARLITGESGVKIAASFKSGRFDRWKRGQRMGKMPHVGELEKPNVGRIPTGVRYKHNQEKAPKEADKYRDDFQVRKKRVDEAREKRVGRFKDGMGSKKELKGMEDIRKARVEKQKKLAKNARPSKKK